MTMKVALKIGYEGTHFAGSQIQPDQRTVEGELLKVLKEIGAIQNFEEAQLSSAGRTDAGVHSISQVVTFYTDTPQMAIPRILNSKFPRDVWAWAHANVDNDFDPRRHAVRRKYRYILNADEYDISKMREAAKLFIGEHNFSNFSKKDKNNPKSTVRFVEKLDVRSMGPVIKIDIVANAYLWNMIRKIVSALIMVSNGTRDIEWIIQMLNPETYEDGIEPAPAYGLVFLDINYDPEPEWMIDNYAVKRINDHFTKEADRFRVISTILEQFVIQSGKENQNLD